MKVPFIDLQYQLDECGEELERAASRVIASKQWVGGAEVEAFEEELADFCDAEYAIGVSSGTDALKVALRACGVRAGDTVITQAYSFVSTAEVILDVGAHIEFTDIDVDSLSIPEDVLKSKLSRSLPGAIIPVQLYGAGSHTVRSELSGIAWAAEVPLIEDACQAIAPYMGVMGDAACLSFFPTKNLGGCGDGGAVLTDDADIAKECRKIRNHGSTRKYWAEKVGGNYRLDPLQAALLRVKLPRLPGWIDRRREVAGWYNATCKYVELPETRGSHTYNSYVVRAEKRDTLRAYLTEQGIGTEVYYPHTLPSMPAFADENNYPVAERLAAESLALPCYPGITREQVMYVCEKIGEFYEKSGSSRGR